MRALINILIFFFIFLIVYQMFLATNTIEGVQNQYQSYDPSNALIMSQQNAGNINYLKDRLDKCQGLYQEVQDLSGNYVTLQQQVNGLLQAQQDYANQMTGGSAPVITGATTDEDTTTSDTN